MSTSPKHISVCICTFRRPHFLKRLLAELEHQVVDNRFTYSIVIADNDSNESARDCVAEFVAKSKVPARYCSEPRQSIALARNKAVENATGDFIAFIDDDEFPCRDWLQELLNTCEQYRVDAVLGPVRPHFAEEPPGWIIRGGFCERPEFPTGRVIKWSEGRTGNILLKREVFNVSNPPFNPVYDNGGEDMDFLQRASARGAAFVWCNEAAVYETVPPSRWKRSYMFKRALLRGKNILKYPTRMRLRLLATSTVAVPLYLLALPVMSLGGQHLFMKYGIKLSDHLGRLLALIGMNPVSEKDA
jgi:glycosyltransferase involved in cell wall biosynthesis